MAEEPDGGSNPLRILLVEDHPDDALLTILALKKQRLEKVTVLNDALKALDYLVQGGLKPEERAVLPDLIIVDLKLPRMDGFDFIESIRKYEDIGRIPLVVLSASSSDKDRERCRELGVDGYLTKPLDIGELNRVLEKVKLC
ncbi:response regulator [Geobacter sp. DSM 9736]|uniref:response regulator n=1 Tax=Geobacter sp. DSM 9736 TaxID=1277350 RepID=UPI000B5119AB|nr:response regulator [Geobacter sp. DSM 9736]SNB44821.1 Response regulator receiver domain-containing protein [Geobacter sp. DSM 9736]